MKIMEIVSACGGGMNGAMLHALLLSRELARRGHEVTMLCHGGSWLAQQLASDPIEVLASDLHRWPTDELRRISAVIGDRSIDVVHTHMSRAHAFGVLLRWFAKVPSVATAQSRHIQLHWMFNDYVVAACDATRRYHRRHNLVRAARIETIHNFIDHRRILEVPQASRDAMRNELGLNDSAKLIGVVGHIIPRKGLIHLVNALPAILAAEPNTLLLAVGFQDKYYLAKVQAAAENLGVTSSIIWLGHREDVADVLSILDLYVLPSLEESLPLTILEAMATGLPVVATNVGGIPECVQAGVTGTLVPPGDSQSLARAVIALLGDTGQRHRYGQAGRLRAIEHFSLERHAQKIEAVFARLCG
jgi:glycosyltransferase involved in cell wall biosynthesis